MLTILLADDNQSIRTGLRKILAEHADFEYRVLEAENGQKAIEILYREQVDILIADIKMPRIDGIQLLKQIKQENYPCEVIMLSGYDDYSLIRSALKLSAFDYLLKPVNISVFIQVLNHARNVVSQRKTMRKSVPEGSGSQAAFPQVIVHIEFFDGPNTEEDPAHAEEYLQDAMNHAVKMNADEAVRCLQCFFDCIHPTSYTPEDVRSMLTHWVYGLMEKNNGFIEIIGTSKLTADDVINCIKSLPTLSQLRTRFPEIIHSYIQTLHAKPEQTERLLIRRAKRFIEENYSGDISLECVSKYLHIHPNYFSTFFKTEMGISFREYRLHYLVDKAKELLAKDDMSIAEIAEHLGYQETPHFNRAFKNITGSTPSRYRRIAQAKEMGAIRNAVGS